MAYREGWPLSDPIITLGSTDQVHISFDDLNTEQIEYSYSLIHCNANWEKSMLARTEFMEGFTENYFEIYDYSFNTNINYIHYQVAIPNDNIQILKSGNYALVVYESGKPQSIVCTACFYVVDYQVNIEPSIDFNTMVDIKKTTQQVNFNVIHPNLTITNPQVETKVIVQQNNRIDNQVTEIAPTFSRPGLLMYTENPKLTFKAGNEYRNFDAVSTRFYGEGIERVEYYNPYYHFTLLPDQKLENSPYLYKQDINGKFLIRRQEADQNSLELESDYIFVHFSIPMEVPLLTGEIFLNGSFTHNDLNETSKMIYSFENKAYECSYFLKQGYYNYRYLVRLSNSNKTTNTPIENDYYETENDYSIFFYYHPQSGRYDQLIGHIKFNSIKKL